MKGKLPSNVTVLSDGKKFASPFQGDDRAFITKFLVQVTLPHRQPRGNPEAWQRRNGNFSLTIRPGLIPSKDGYERLGYPSGSIPRLLLLWMTREVLRKRSRQIQLGHSLPSFMEALGLNPHNGSLRSIRSDRKRLQTQMNNLFRSQIMFGYVDPDRQAWRDLSVTTQGEIWWDFYSDGLVLFDSWVELGEHFYESLLESPVPLSMEALQQLKNSSLSLDLYAWSAYAAFTASKRGEPFRVTWRKLHESLGADYSRVRDFKKKATVALKKVLEVYPDLRIEDDGDLLLVRSSMTPVRPLIHKT